MKNEERLKIGNKVSNITIVVNIILSFIKILFGIIGHSAATIADGIHSLSDVLSTIAVIIGLKISSKPADKDHPYGHEKLEAVTSKLLATMLFLTALFIGYSGIKVIINKDFSVPSKITIYVAILSIVTKEWMYRYTLKAAKKINSTALEADAWHHRSDSFSSIGTLIGIVGARLKYPILDPIASLVICIFIIKVSIDIYKNSINQLVDHCADEKTINMITEQIKSIKEVERIDELKTRLHGSKLYVDVEIALDYSLSLKESHSIAEKVHDKIEASNNDIIHCMVHVNPYEE
ncbi:cation transporter [Clostridium botulinum]|uniref:Cation transporter n=1 Tax=Clostridium botulinum TaxID=1491 RepID=A0ABD7CPY3_CLOBO|nr:cation diffusion facilitator family transporter [Clostridium botulinum]AJD27294.1 cation diffusion facilitator transporter family protein [Clostridium botulinum CDC_297]APC81916.1 cation diffusion facilitator transporter family protein [Clostridium botulinum]APR00406.1 cation diffusion facilitator transporter family protein [Clostridium botulinum]AUN02860.1 cation-efflux pump [Clostridium botulinum]KGO12174.1 cation diffusion facilitator family transporter [Clostridium botulinum]